MPHTGLALSLLKHRRVWQELDEEVRQRLEAVGGRERHPRGGILWGPDDERGELQLVIEGRLRVFRFDPLGREIVIGILEDGELVCEDDAPSGSPGYVEALEPSEILRIRRVELQAILDEATPELAAALRGAGARGEPRV